MNMNIASLIPTIIAVLMMFTTLVQAAPNVGEKGGARREAGAKGAEDRPGEESLDKLRERIKAMTPDERKEFLKNHPEAVERLKERVKEAAGKEAPSGDKRAEFLKDHPELKEHLEKLKAMSPDERKAWLKDHPEVAEKLEKAKAKLKEKAEDATPEQKEKLKGKIKERLEKMTPEQKEEFFKKHPEAKEKLEEAKK
jgi:2-oxo-4-hydroxy-4-carboxy--5-ureidoimidazoline (OHCU) decarboxylase